MKRVGFAGVGKVLNSQIGEEVERITYGVITRLRYKHFKKRIPLISQTSEG